MREIKFRGKTIEGEWVYGYLCMTKWTSCTPVENKGTWHEPKYEATEEYAHQVKCLEINKGRWWFAAIQQTKNLNSILEVDPETVGQDTGYKGIHQGDICKVTQGCGETGIGEVVWDERKLCWALDVGYELIPFSVIIDCEHEVEVKGNIHDNPELLEGDEGE